MSQQWDDEGNPIDSDAGSDQPAGEDVKVWDDQGKPTNVMDSDS